MAGRKPVTKKVINSPETCVDDNLRGVVAVYPALKLHPKHRVITVRTKNDTGRVAVLGGGGSGHEPFAAGMVGSGMLDGAVAGGVFASPPTGHVLYGIAHLYKYNSGGVLVIIGNYTGDRLNFGKAIEKAKIAGIKVEGLIVGEDVASSQNKTGGRSMVGEVIFYKLCGAMAQKGYELVSIRDMAAEANKYMATLGVCLSACSLPGQPPLFEILSDEMELGAGVHGEAGIRKMKLGTAREVVAMILDQVIDHLKLKAGDRTAVTIDNLGSTSFLEMNIISAETKDYLESKQIVVERIFSGHLKTSLEMHGFQICVLHLNREHGDLWLELLDFPTDAAGWTGGVASQRGEVDHGDDLTLLQADGRKMTSGPSLGSKQQAVLKASLTAAAAALVKSEALLNRLDSGCGDGDCGITLKKFAQATLSYLENADLEHPSSVLWALSEAAETDMGGTSGGIYSLGLAAASQALANAKCNDPAAWLSAWEQAMAAITKYGGAEPGDRTMLDTLHTAASAFKANLNADLKTLLQKTADAAEVGCRATANMTARAGRASYVSEEHVSGEDAGARAAALWLRAVLDSIAQAY
ncbi:PREDICTED: bifunctional ATP-dependent dihydroxyacetone kinase/FAD-AMP lyase (cyclizing)-like [Papilio xuthus]|uniref:Triokinase/FMN cyclase n=1 Tax=Papilio xuthus TaxID=66420 RepID=A0AAJ6ZY52_PAPXU|nr:PREDICTED: bifunctional ATP-dependent dihydroxyacetone kinase/FAD-AMP lyase (cyclizing)-like [Papilio xuthus]XP_013181566.1 PREDICTED: bifunctional ATP-dependent dihydroxyacetone kinase/FAD-AMP lyase (cyclizing)-like [Papilio xuthus]XP_013181567.1 PREDICTED: bifunctional ATP-dependent dihydroxyacetone kinase/FAD-AMP lyase (cyclizing)-like [Papilio xuthus]XP_013181568.1 PREDICTED: bifunctional ATP-dependent dihydroxyacetone kinase/FAD-AMP lyase (cyclizing)-like [Papilio xuthus]